MVVVNIFFLLFIALFVGHSTLAENTEETKGSAYTVSLPKYEFGVGGGTFRLPHYPGADQTMQKSILIPYMIYRGNALKVDRQGRLRADFFESEQYDVDLSVAGAFASDSLNNRARVGMDDLDWLVEVGPRLVFHLLKNRRSYKATVDLNLPVRWVLSTDFGRVDHRGFSFSPELIYRHPNFLFSRLTLISSITMIYATEVLQDYFYEVPDRFATAQRVKFNASGGYMSSRILIGLGYRFNKDLLLFSGFQGSYYDGAINGSSPLLRSKWGQSIGIGLSWRLYVSEQVSTVTFDREDY